MTVEKLSGLLGICRRAGRLVTGFDAVVALCSTQSALLMIASDASPRTVKELQFRLTAYTVYRLPITKEQTAAVLGSSKPVAVLATADEGFAKAIRNYFTEEESHYDD